MRPLHRLALALACALLPRPALAADPLPSWNEGPSKAAGKLDLAWTEAHQKGWTVVDTKTEWKRVSPVEP